MNRRQRSHAQGVAILLVIIAVAMATILSVTFLAAQSTSLGIAQNIRRHPQAQQIAESGLATIVKQIEKDTQWRKRFTHGLWVNNQSLHGGTLTIHGLDPVDSDLADSAIDDLKLRVIGTYQGVTHELNALLKFESLAGGSAQGVVTSGKITLTGSSVIDSYDSSKGAYGGSNVGSNATIVTTSTSPNTISFDWSTYLKGNAVVGVGGNPNNVIKQSQKDWGTNQYLNITGTQTALTSAITWPAVAAIPAGLPANEGSKTYASWPQHHTISSNRHFDKMELNGNTRVTISGNVSIRVNKKFIVTGDAWLVLAPGAKLTLYVGESININGASKVNADNSDPSRLVIYGRGTGYEHVMTGNVRVHAIVDSPTSKLKVEGSSELFGAYMGTELLVNGNSRMHVDTNPAIATANPRLPTGSGGGGGGGSGGSKLVQTQWLELP